MFRYARLSARRVAILFTVRFAHLCESSDIVYARKSHVEALRAYL